MSLDTFEPLTGDVFVADFGDEGTIEMSLVVVRAVPTGNDDVVSFALEFDGPADRVFQQGTIPLEHDVLGSLEIFLVAVGEGAGHRRYEAVFNRLVG